MIHAIPATLLMTWLMANVMSSVILPTVRLTNALSKIFKVLTPRSVTPALEIGSKMEPTVSSLIL